MPFGMKPAVCNHQRIVLAGVLRPAAGEVVAIGALLAPVRLAERAA